MPGAFVYNPAAGNVPAAGTLQLTATFTPTDTTDYASATAKNTLVVGSSNNPIQGIQGKTCPISAGASQATIQSALNSCGSGNTVVLAAGTYSIGSTLTLPCGVSAKWAGGALFADTQPDRHHQRIVRCRSIWAYRNNCRLQRVSIDPVSRVEWWAAKQRQS